MASLEDLIAAKDALADRYLRAWRGHEGSAAPVLSAKAARSGVSRNVHAVGVGRKIKDGKARRTLCVRVYVLQKLEQSAIPRQHRIPKKIHGLPTDVIESSPAYAHHCSTDRLLHQDPAVGGISAAHQLVNRATLGCFCHSLRKKEAGNLYMLGNNHAFANANAGQPDLDRILQQSPGDGGTAAADALGTLTRFVPLRFGGQRRNVVDAAIAQVTQRSVLEEVCTIGRLAGTGSAIEGMIVCKHGRTTGYTEGAVVDVALDVRIGYGALGEAYFTNQFRVDPVAGYSPFVRPGDSGSVIVAKESRSAVGLHFAGGDVFSIANPMVDVCRLLEIRIP